MDDLKQKLEELKADNLRVLLRDLRIQNHSSLTSKNQMVEAILHCDRKRVQRLLRKTWIDSHRTGILIGVLSVVLTVVFGVITLPYWWTSGGNQNGSVPQFDPYGSLHLNIERRNALQCIELEGWLNKITEFKGKYFTDSPPTQEEYDRFILEFIDYAETDFTPAQIGTFNVGFGSGAGGEMFKGIDKLSDAHKEQASQLALIEFWLIHFVKLNRKGEEPAPPHWG